MRPTAITLALEKLIPTRRPMYLWGPPGVGKSSLVKQAARRLLLKVLDVRGVLLDPVDLMGLPAVKGGKTVWSTPGFLPQDGCGVLFLDELAQAPPLVQAALLSLCLDRRVGEYKLPEGWVIVAASNRQEDRAGAHRLISPLLNRFIHLDLEVSNDDWQEWAAREGIVPEVRGCLRFKPGLLFQFDPKENARAFPTPRSWSFVSEALPYTPEDLIHPVVAGCVGEGAAAEFCAFRRVYKSLPDIDEVLKDPAKAPVPTTQLDVLHAVVVALIERVRDAKSNTAAGAEVLSSFAIYGQRLPEDFGVLALREAIAIRPQEMFTVPGVSGWVRKLRSKGVFTGSAT